MSAEHFSQFSDILQTKRLIEKTIARWTDVDVKDDAVKVE